MIKGFVIWFLSFEYCCYSHHLPKEDECFLGRRVEGGEIDLGLLEPREGGWNHLPGVSGNWRGSEGSGVLPGISNTTGGRSSRGCRRLKRFLATQDPHLWRRSAMQHAEGSVQGPSPFDCRSAIVR